MHPVKYHRVIPRDLFNEAKLLKCIGRLSLLILDNMVPCKIEIDENGQPFNICLLDEGSLTISNYRITVKGIELIFKTTYNSKANFPLYCECDEVDYLVFDEEGNFSEEFNQFINGTLTKF